MKRYIACLKDSVKLLFSRGDKIVFLGGTSDVNLGDNAQRVLIRKWCIENYPTKKYIEIPIGDTCCAIAPMYRYVLISIMSAVLFGVMRLKQRAGDLYVFSSGYGFIDHAWDWLVVARLAIACPKVAILVMPQTINFMNPWIGRNVATVLNKHPRMMILCRDFISLEYAKERFDKCHPIAYPDIVTSLIGTRTYENNARNGILFCMRGDKEAFYGKEAIQSMAKRFSCKVEEVDTTPDISVSLLDKRREEIIDNFLRYIAKFQVVVTDRYHGTIFSLVTGTPVVVIASVDHKLSSGVKWFPAEVFGKNIQFADTLDKAYEIACEYLKRTEFPALPTYFKDKYWDKLKGAVDATLLAR